ncbi:MAG: hypothetical protein C4329_14660 [Chitinophagaceae bacterium]
MKEIKKIKHHVTALITTLFLSAMAFAQEKSVDININKSSGTNWYSSPIVWIIGAALFILLLVALLRNNNSKD